MPKAHQYFDEAGTQNRGMAAPTLSVLGQVLEMNATEVSHAIGVQQEAAASTLSVPFVSLINNTFLSHGSQLSRALSSPREGVRRGTTRRLGLQARLLNTTPDYIAPATASIPNASTQLKASHWLTNSTAVVHLAALANHSQQLSATTKLVKPALRSAAMPHVLTTALHKSTAEATALTQLGGAPRPEEWVMLGCVVVLLLIALGLFSNLACGPNDPCEDKRPQVPQLPLQVRPPEASPDGPLSLPLPPAAPTFGNARPPSVSAWQTPPGTPRDRTFTPPPSPRSATGAKAGEEVSSSLNPYTMLKPNEVSFQDPRCSRRREIGIIGFAARASSPYEQGRLDGPDACDALCGAPFLGLGFPCGGILVPSVSMPDGQRGQAGPFQSAEAALQALNGHGDWRATAAVLYSKFRRGTACANALRTTGDAFLLEHGGDQGLEKVWAGRGTNRLGLQLMIIRDELTRDEEGETALGGDPMTWTEFARDVCKIDLSSGQQENAGVHPWQSAIKSATSKIVLKLLSEHGGRRNQRSLSGTP